MAHHPLTSLLFDPDRLAVAGALAARSLSSDDLCTVTHRPRDVVLSALGDLRAAGIVVPDGDGRYVLDEAALRAAAQEVAEVAIPMDPVIGYGMTEDDRQVLARFFSGRVLIDIPTQRAKRLVVLQRLVLEFDPGRRYLEAEVNAILGAFHPDWSSLRRGLVDEGLLDRAPTPGGNEYWRSGGRVVDPPPG